MNENCHQWTPVRFYITWDYDLNKASWSSVNLLHIEYFQLCNIATIYPVVWYLIYACVKVIFPKNINLQSKCCLEINIFL